MRLCPQIIKVNDEQLNKENLSYFQEKFDRIIDEDFSNKDS